MPQTREHATVLQALGVDTGVVAITKADVADPELASAEAAELLPGAEVVAVSAKTGAGLDELRAAFAGYGPAYDELLATSPDPDAWVIERGEYGEFHSKMGLRLAQVVHHGSDHRSQVCTALTSLGITPPEIDLWAYGEAMGRTRDVELSKG